MTSLGLNRLIVALFCQRCLLLFSVVTVKSGNTQLGTDVEGDIFTCSICGGTFGPCRCMLCLFVIPASPVPHPVFLSPGVIAVSDTRSPAADPSGPGVGASGSHALCSSGGLFSQQVNRLTPSIETFHFLLLLLLQTKAMCLSFRYKQEEVKQKAAQNPKGTVMIYR